MSTKYCDYFRINENYFPSVNEEVLSTMDKDFWKTFYPHDTFVKLLKDAERVLSRKDKLSIWVEGAYGTGKSHAVLTLKKLLDASSVETKEYFDKYPQELSSDLFNKIQGIKSQGKILTVHRYGAASISNDRDLIMAIQESIKNAIENANLKFKAEETFKDSIIKWLSDGKNSTYFDSYIKDEYYTTFEGDTTKDIINKLNTMNDKDLIILINKIFRVADQIGIQAMRLEINDLTEWIKNVIKANDLKSLFFIWDEFTEYFNNNKNALTGFQELIELSATQPFCLLIVTHKSGALFHDTDSDKKKILDRFINPTCNIELPENMALRLMGAAMEKTTDVDIRNAWEDEADDLNMQLHDSRKLVMDSAKITEKELKNILPIHPYTALLLKYLSSAFNSNQRSMFDFIKNNRGEEIKGFQWFIKNFGTEDDWNLLTIDMLWDFFYEKGKEHLAPEIRTILDTYNKHRTGELTEEEKRVYQTILLLQAISQKTGDSVELFIPNDKNINNAFDGTNLEGGQAIRIAEKLVRDELLFKKQKGLNKFQYSAMVNAGDSGAIDKIKKEINKETKDLLSEGLFSNILNLSGALKLRYVIKVASVETLRQQVREVKSNIDKYKNNIVAIMTFARNDEERVSMLKLIRDVVEKEDNILIVDASKSMMGEDDFEQYKTNLANSSYYRGNDNSLANQYSDLATQLIEKWKQQILGGEFNIYQHQTSEIYVNNIDDLFDELKQINRKKYPKGIENFKVIDNMFTCFSINQGVACGAEEKTAATFRSANPKTQLETALNGVWQVKNYWTINRSHIISQIKNEIENFIEQEFNKTGRVSIVDIYELLKNQPYGFMPCNLTAFVLGFLLKEYANESYRWSDDNLSENMSVDKLKSMIKEVIDMQSIPNPRYKEQYIQKMTQEEKEFAKITSQIFSIPEKACSSIEQIRDRLRGKLKELVFPIWTLKEIVKYNTFKTNFSVVIEAIDCYIGVANAENIVISSGKKELDYAMDLGRLSLENQTLLNDLKELINKDNCKKGIVAYIQKYNGGKLMELSKLINDSDEYINVLKRKFDADAANWVWNVDTVEKRIDDVILEYSIVNESTKFTEKTTSFNSCINAWCNKVSFIKLSFDAIMNYIDDVRPLLELVLMIKKRNSLPEEKKSEFFNLLQTKEEAYKNFYKNQIKIFKEVASFYLNDLTDEQIDTIYNDIDTGVFTKDKTEYLKLVENKIIEYKKKLGKEKLRKLWLEKTGTASPIAWSTKYEMPILAMISDNEVKAKKVFAIISKNNPDESEVKEALAYLNAFNRYDDLKSEEKRNEAFIAKIIKQHKVMLPDVAEVKECLLTRTTDDAYYWYQNADVDSIIKQFAESKYNTGGCDKALQKIEAMDAEKVKDYLKRLIKDNMIVGVEIIND